MTVPWPTRSVLAGTAGTAALTASYAIERRLRPQRKGPLDYDDSLVPGQIVASVMHLGHVSGREDQRAGNDPPMGLRLGLWALARVARPALSRAGADRDLRDHADERHVLTVPTAGSDAATVALARGCDGNLHRHPRRVRRRGRHHR